MTDREFVIDADGDRLSVSDSAHSGTAKDAFWFCLVLLVEIYGLSVALGGPGLEVAYFLLVVISQTVAGAYIWAHLRRHELRLPIPELLAMGFAIGSSSAAISQLILRDLLGVRLLISPYVPIIGVGIWLFLKRSTKLSTQITHTDSTTLLWLLFPAPLALSHYVWLLLPLYLAPLLFLVFLAHKLGKSLNQKYNFPIIVATITFLSVFTNLVINAVTNVSPSLALAEADLLFDIGHSVVSSTFGIVENISMSGQNFQYYKFAYLWLGPILTNTTQIGITTATTIVPLLFLLVIGLALWTLTYFFSKSSRAANIASVIFFALATIPKPILLEIRVGYLFPYFIVICGGILVLKSHSWGWRTSFVLITLTTFVITYSRIFLLPTLLVFALTSLIIERAKVKNLLTRFAVLASSAAFGSLFAIYLIFSSLDFSRRQDIQMVNIGSSVVSIATSAAPIAIILINNTQIPRQHSRLRIHLILLFPSHLILHLFAPRQFPSSTTFILPLFILLTPSISTIIDSSTKLIECKKSVCIKTALPISLFSFAYTGFFLINQESTGSSSNLGRIYWRLFIQQSHGSNKEYAALRLQLFEISAIFLLTAVGFLATKKFGSGFFRTLAIAIVAMLFGNSLAISTRQFLKDPAMTSTAFAVGEASQSIRWSNSSRIVALDAARSLIENGSTIATNFGNYESDGPIDTFVVAIHLRALSFLSPPYFSPNGVEASSIELAQTISHRKLTSIDFPVRPSSEMLENMLSQNVKWFVVDLERTKLRDWEPWATTRYINDKVAILELAQEIPK